MESDDTLSDTTARTNRQGDLCPPWCIGDHASGRVSHGGARITITVPGRSPLNRDEIDVCPLGMPGIGSEILLKATRYGRDDRPPELWIKPDAAGSWAGLIEMLAGATRAQHRELAEAIRQAAALITGDTDA